MADQGKPTQVRNIIGASYIQIQSSYLSNHRLQFQSHDRRDPMKRHSSKNHMRILHFHIIESHILFGLRFVLECLILAYSIASMYYRQEAPNHLQRNRMLVEQLEEVLPDLSGDVEEGVTHPHE